MKAKQIVAIVSLAVILAAGLFAIISAHTNATTADDYASYDGSGVDVDALYASPTGYETEGAAGVADVIVKQNLSETEAANNVAAVVFDFRGFDTLGESFILLTAIAGAYVILSKSKKSKKGDK